MNRKHMLKKNREFRYVYRRGKAVGSNTLVLYYVSSRIPDPRVGFSVSKKVGNSVVRNRVRRRLKESFRHSLPEVRGHVSIVLVARPQASLSDYEKLDTQLRALLSRAGLLRGKQP